MKIEAVLSWQLLNFYVRGGGFNTYITEKEAAAFLMGMLNGIQVQKINAANTGENVK